MDQDLETLNNLKVGIIGCGHLGQAIARSLVRAGLEKSNLLISYGGNPLTYQKLEANALASCLATNKNVFEQAGIVLITIKPKDVFAIRGIALAGNGLVVSCMAGVPINLINGILETNVHRMMFSGPDTITAKIGVAAMYPEHEYLEILLRVMNLTSVKLMAEDDMDIFTAGVCMPAAILAEKNLAEQQNAIDRIKVEYPLLLELYAWALKVLPDFISDEEKTAYIKKMITRGGVTDAIIRSIAQGEPFDDALIKGIVRTKQIASEIEQLITA